MSNPYDLLRQCFLIRLTLLPLLFGQNVHPGSYGDMTDFGNVLNDVRYAVTETQMMATTVLKNINDWSEKGGIVYRAKSYDEAVE